MSHAQRNRTGAKVTLRLEPGRHGGPGRHDGRGPVTVAHDGAGADGGRSAHCPTRTAAESAGVTSGGAAATPDLPIFTHPDVNGFLTGAVRRMAGRLGRR